MSVRAELMDRKRVRCPACHRDLGVVRYRQDDGTHLLFIDTGRGAWEPTRTADDVRAGIPQRLERNWARLEEGRSTWRHAWGRRDWLTWHPLPQLLCACGEDVVLDPAALQADTPPPAFRFSMRAGGSRAATGWDRPHVTDPDLQRAGATRLRVPPRRSPITSD